jgi:hypothetical protein
VDTNPQLALLRTDDRVLGIVSSALEHRGLGTPASELPVHGGRVLDLVWESASQ